MRALSLQLLPERFAILRLEPSAAVPAWAQGGALCSVTRTTSELSLVCPERLVPPTVGAERGWRALTVPGPLDFSEVGILAAIAVPLAEAGVSIFPLSTYDTDYVLLREGELERALEALCAAGLWHNPR